ncbi:MAG TPA: rhomboid family intramembrane serine protease [Marmoricola sp.]
MSDPHGAAAPHCYRHPDRETWIRCQRCDRPICPDCMESAAVGFQCPSCVKDGAKSTRTGLLPYGGTRVADPRLTSIGLIAINVFVWVLILVNHGSNGSLLAKLSLIPQGQCDAGGSRYFPTVHTAQVCATQTTGHWVNGVADGSYWQIVTSMFTHVEVTHIGLNMLSLFFIGPPLEMIFGRARFLATYLVGGLVGSASVMLFADSATLTYGASGAIFGVMGALLVIGVRARIDMQQLWVWLGINLVYTFVASNISWQGHLGGLAGGAAAAAVIAYAPRANRTPIQIAGLAGITVVAIVAIVLRAGALG